MQTRVTEACIILTLIGYALLSMVSYLEHTRSVRPSTLLSAYLGLSTILDLPRVRTIFFISMSRTVAATLLAALLVKLLLFTIELYEKRAYLQPDFRDEAPEGLASVYNRALFLWLNRLFIRGYNTLLTINTLIAIDSHLTSASKPTKLNDRWQRGA